MKEVGKGVYKKESTFGSSELVSLFERKEVCEIKMKDVLNSEGRWEGRGL